MKYSAYNLKNHMLNASNNVEEEDGRENRIPLSSPFSYLTPTISYVIFYFQIRQCPGTFYCPHYLQKDRFTSPTLL